MSFNIIVKKGGENPNTIYREAKEAKRKFSKHLLSKSQMQNATKENVFHQVHFEENHSKDVREYRDKMKRLDKDPDARNVEKLRSKR